MQTKDLAKHLTSIEDIEARTRLDFLKEIWDGSEQAIESHVQPRLWGEPTDDKCTKLS